MMIYDLIVIGGGPAGLAAAVSAREHGLKEILILERDDCGGGILNQCIHNGFGLHTFREELTGPEYASRYLEKVNALEIPCWFHTMVLDISADKIVTAVSRDHGLVHLEARSVILAMGCRERPRGALNIPGMRPAGIFSAGTAQRMVNIEGRLPGRNIAILGSGDIGLIMARRMMLEGAHVSVVAELMPYSGGLKRNIVQCLEDFDIPLRLSHTVTQIHGSKRIEGITLAKVDQKSKPIPGTEEYIPCDTLLLSVGLIPENELSRQAGIRIDPVTQGPIVDETLETSIPGIFACGNVLHVHDLVDYVSEEAASAGAHAAVLVQKLNGADSVLKSQAVQLKPGYGIRYTVPQKIHSGYEPVTVRFRSRDVYRNCRLCATDGETILFQQKKTIVTPGEMLEIHLSKEQTSTLAPGSEFTIYIEEGDA